MSNASKKGSLEFHINLKNIKNERAFLMKMKESFQLPDYFGFTLDGLDDCMQSLEWIEHKQILAKFYHLEEVKAHNEVLYSEILSSLHLYNQYWQDSPEKKVIFEY
ncbi:MAG: barstar family protein [Capnocytophaga sp.]|nr:barstar family protein [Capnocytophaga sp.]